MKRLKKYLLHAALILAILYAATLGALYFSQETLLFHPQVLAADYAFHFPAPYREIRLPVAGAELHGLHFRHENPQGAIVFFHGNAGSLAHWGKIGARLAALGYDCYLFDYRGYGKSSGSLRSEAQMLADVEAMMAYIRRDSGNKPLTLIGYSLGSGMAAYAAAHYPVERLILVSPFYTLRGLIQEKYPIVPAPLIKYPLPSAEYLTQSAKTPLLLIHGRRDTLIPLAHSHRLRAQFSDRASLHELDAEHGDIGNDPVIWKVIGETLRQ